MKLSIVLLYSLLLSLSNCVNKALKKTEYPLANEIRLPSGYHISLFADTIENARSLVLGDKGTVFVGNRDGNKVYALVDANGDGRADEKYIIASKLNMPNGVAFYKGALYVAEVDKIWRYDAIEDRLKNPPSPVLIFDSLPHDKHHGWKYIAFGPDGKLYIPVGAPCNNCDDNEKDPRYASICRINTDGSGFEIFASGIRNTVGFDWHPQTAELWFTENGRDNLGDDIPGDELNHAPEKGMNFGFPYCHQGSISDPEYGKKHNCNEFIPPVAILGPHVAALGMKFYTGSMFPAGEKNSIFIAEHGSWNRSTPVGYKISKVSLKADGSTVYQTFADGWLKDGSMLVSDDFANAIYRITYSN